MLQHSYKILTVHKKTCMGAVYDISETKLNELGQKGWQLVTIMDRGYYFVYYFIKTV